ncbi:beta-1,6-N-acetylglucosaminyltransferase [Paracoccus pacificus]|uniref:Peptide O-xylosyltransferase n=1 Tax=Paracoccus pacificus TaxID=1463598 RepID=A0ABW4R2X6_9RHOB
MPAETVAATRLGVVFMCHDAPEQAARRARIWAEGGAAVVVHADKKMSHKDTVGMEAALADLPDLSFCARTNCAWGTWSLVEATLTGVEQLLRLHPDVTNVLLASGACLPLRPVAELTAYLERHRDVDFIESTTVADVGWTIGGLHDERFSMYFPFKWKRNRWLFDRWTAIQRRLKVDRHRPEGIAPHIGSQWWCLSRRTLEAILTDPRRAEFDRYFRMVWIPDESYFQTLSRRHSHRVESRSLTLAKFDQQGKPYTFYDDHAEILQESRCFIARKIWPRAERLNALFPQPVRGNDPAAEPDPARIDRIINQAVLRRTIGRPGLYMQSRFPAKDRENGKTSNRYVLLQGFTDLFPDFEGWLQDRVGMRVHGHLFAPGGAEFAGRVKIGPGALSSSAAVRDYDPQGFLTSLIRSSGDTPQLFQFSPRDTQALNWFMTTDNNARIAVITGAWAVPLLHSDMPFDDVRHIAGILQRREKTQVDILRSVWAKATISIWELADFVARPEPILRDLLTELSLRVEEYDLVLPPMRDMAGFADFLQRLRNAGLQPLMMGQFSAEAQHDEGAAG